MNLSYVAAEYFIEALKKSSTFSISHDEVNTLIKQADKVLASYLKHESKNDILFIFKKFPDVFIYNGNTVSLTDAFLSLYAFPSSVNFSTTYECANAFETAVVEYFKLMLSRAETFHYVELFNMLLTNNALQLTEYFSHYNSTDMYNFFLTRSNTFTLLKSNVYLKINPLVEVTSSGLEQEPSSKSLKRLKTCTSFLLTCFASLHYIELKQCISFVLSPVKEFLNKHSLIKQREIFENFSETTMDRWGFLVLKKIDADMPTSRKIRLIVLIVCILAFEREMHFEKLVHLVKSRTSSVVYDILCSLSISEQFKFFKSFSEFFVIAGNGFVSLLPSFVFPLCSFENSALILQCNQKAAISYPVVDKKISSNSLSTSSDVQSKSQNCSKNQIVELQNNPQNFQTANVPATLQTSNFCSSVSTPLQNSLEALQSKPQDYICTIVNNKLKVGLQNAGGKSIDLNLLSNALNYLPGIIGIRLKLSIIFLQYGFSSSNFKNVLKSCLYVLDDVRIHFCNAFSVDQSIFIQQSYALFSVKLNNDLIYDMYSYVNEKERTLLFFVYILLEEGYMHYLKLSEAIISTKFYSLSLFKRVNDPLKYFEEMGGYLNILDNGCICLNKSFYDLNSVIESHLTPSSKTPTSACIVSANGLNSTSPNNIILDASKSQSGSTVQIENKINSNRVKTSKETKNVETQVPLYIWKRFELFIFCIKNSFVSLVANYTLEAFLHSLTDVKTYFSNLSFEEQHKFIEEYFQLINNGFLEIYVSDIQSSNTYLTEDEKVILIVTYILIKEKSLHYEFLVKELKNLKFKCSLCSSKPASQFKYFKTLNAYFCINSDGFVCLSSSFFSLSSLISSICVFTPEIQRKFKSNIKIKIITEICLESESPSSISSESSLKNSVINLSVQNVKPERSILIANKVDESNDIDFHKKGTKIDFLVKNEDVKNSSTNTSSNYVIDVIVDACFSLLSASKKMHVEILCSRLNSCDIKIVQNYFSFFTIAKKIQFFTNLPQYFDVTRDGFVSLKENLSYVPKTDLAVIQSTSATEKAVGAQSSSESRSVDICNLSESSESQSYKSNSSTNTKKKNRRNSKNNSPAPRMFSIAPQALTNIKTFLNSGRTTKKFESSWTTKCDNVSENIQNTSVAVSQNSSVTSVSFSPKSSSCQEFNFIETSGKKELQKKTSDSSVFKFSATSEIISDSNQKSNLPLDTKLSPRPHESSHVSKTVNSCTKAKSMNGNLDIHTVNSSVFKCNDLPQEEQLIQNFKKCVSQEKSLDSLKTISKESKIFTMGTHNLPINCDKNNLDSKDILDDSYESYGAELLDSFLGELNPDVCILGSSSCDKSVGVIELRAVNFFCTILGNYEIGVSVDFLISHLNLASSEVQTCVLNLIKNNKLSFFSKHKKVFYVSPQTNNIYLRKKD